METLKSQIDPASPDFAANRAHHLALRDDLRALLTRIRQGGSAEARQKHEERGKLFARDRIDGVLDPGSAFLELSPLAAHKDQVVVLSNLAHAMAGPQGPGDNGGDHTRCPAVFLNGVHPKRTDGADIQAGTTIDQMAAEKIGQDTLLPSLELQSFARRPLALSLETFQSLPAAPWMIANWAVPGANAGTPFPPLGSYHLGVLAVGLMAAGALAGRAPRGFFVALLAVGFLMSIGSATPVSALAYELPLLGSFRHPFKHLLEVGLAAARKAGFSPPPCSSSVAPDT